MFQIDILGSKGHEELKFDSAGAAKAKIKELLAKGYSLVTNGDGGTHKVTDCDEATSEYVCESEKRVAMSSVTLNAIAPEAGG